ncbi:Molybdenum cofactor guanylyltransferase [hydrothermal vent metagenome]|uniref:Molybdenum cofactor guanylyltransferase n=1 Tax=hydrothermal vent metagenome TaxID=652676 RepID=A0A3B0ZZ26_9ZZZZ
MPTNEFIKNISGVILAGGKSSRMGEDKALKKVNDVALIEFSINNLQHQVKTLFINTNQNQQDYLKFGYPLIKDLNPDHLGPLSGIYSALKTITTNWAFFGACDTPCLPKDIVARLYEQAQQQQKLIAVVKTQKKLQPLVLLVHKDLCKSLNSFITSGERKTQLWITQQQPAIVDCSNELDAFANINTAQDFIDFENKQIEL